MTLLDIHPEHLIDRVLRGQANERERAELESHLRACTECAAEWQLALALREPAQTDARSTAAAIDGVLAMLASEGRVAAPSTMRAPGVRPARAWLPWAVAACLFFTGTAAAATLVVAVKLSSNAPAAPAEPARAAPVRSAAPRAHAAAPAQRAQAAAPAPAPLPPLAVEPNEQPDPPRAHGHAAQRPPPTAGELFAQARAAAMRGQDAAAAALFAVLERRFAESEQAHVARLLLGRLYLERLGSPREALAQFDGYLERGGANRPEALLGRARALRKLGREREEIAALRELVDAYPDSWYVAPAEQRLRTVE